VWVLSVWFGFALRSLALCRVCAVAPSFVSDWRAFSYVSLCNSATLIFGATLLAALGFAWAVLLFLLELLLGMPAPVAGMRSHRSLVRVTFGATLLVAVGFVWVWLLFLLAPGLGLDGLPAWVCLEPVSCVCVLCGLRLFVFGLGSLPFGAHAVCHVPRPSL
jgi:hypothetical protein